MAFTPSSNSNLRAERRKARAAANRKVPKRKQPKAVQPIRRDEMYPFELIPSLLGISIEAIRDAQDAGMKTGRFGVKKYVDGAELIRYINALGDQYPR